MARCTVCYGDGVCKYCRGKGCGKCAETRSSGALGFGGTTGNGKCAACDGTGNS